MSDSEDNLPVSKRHCDHDQVQVPADEVGELKANILSLKNDLERSRSIGLSVFLRNSDLEKEVAESRKKVKELEDKLEEKISEVATIEDSRRVLEEQTGHLEKEAAELRMKFEEEIANLNQKHSEEMKKLESKLEQKKREFANLAEIHQQYSKCVCGVLGGKSGE